MKLSILTNMVTPYRAPLFKAIASDPRIACLRILACTEREPDRDWQVNRDDGYMTSILWGLTWTLRHNENGLRIIHLRLGIVWELIRNRPDCLIIGDASWTSYLAALACLTFNIPYAIWNEITPLAIVRKGLITHVRSLIYRNATYSIASGNLARQFLLDHGSSWESIRIAHNAIDNNHFLSLRHRYEPLRAKIRESLGIDSNAFTLLFVGQLIKRKRIKETIAASAKANDHHPVYLLIAGKGPLEASLRVYASSLGYCNVSFCGHADQEILSQYYVACDALILLSDFEPWGMVVNEALLFGKPVIVSPEVVSGIELQNTFKHNEGIINVANVSSADTMIVALAEKQKPCAISPPLGTEETYDLFIPPARC